MLSGASSNPPPDPNKDGDKKKPDPPMSLPLKQSDHICLPVNAVGKHRLRAFCNVCGQSFSLVKAAFVDKMERLFYSMQPGDKKTRQQRKEEEEPFVPLMQAITPSPAQEPLPPEIFEVIPIQVIGIDHDPGTPEEDRLISSDSTCSSECPSAEMSREQSVDLKQEQSLQNIQRRDKYPGEALEMKRVDDRFKTIENVQGSSSSKIDEGADVTAKFPECSRDNSETKDPLVSETSPCNDDKDREAVSACGGSSEVGLERIKIQKTSESNEGTRQSEATDEFKDIKKSFAQNDQDEEEKESASGKVEAQEKPEGSENVTKQLPSEP